MESFPFSIFKKKYGKKRRAMIVLNSHFRGKSANSVRGFDTILEWAIGANHLQCTNSFSQFPAPVNTQVLFLHKNIWPLRFTYLVSASFEQGCVPQNISWHSTGYAQKKWMYSNIIVKSPPHLPPPNNVTFVWMFTWALGYVGSIGQGQGGGVPILSSFRARDGRWGQLGA